MAEVLGIASSITTLIENTVTVIKYVKDVKNAPEERAKLLKELQDVGTCLSMIEMYTRSPTEDDPWLVTLQQLHDPVNELTELLDGLKAELKAGSSRWKKYSQRLKWTLKKENMAETLSKIERFKTLFMIAAQHDNLKLSRAIQKTLSNVKGKVWEILANTDITRQLQMDEKATKVAEWLTSWDYNAVQRDKLTQRVGNTGLWFLESSKFLSWVDGSAQSSTLWCPGDPGAGKTILASIIVADLRLRLAQRNVAVLCVFCDYRNTVAQTVTNIIRNLLKQLIQAQCKLPSSIESLYEECRNGQTDPSLEDLKTLLSIQLNEYSCVYLVLDALDEFPGDCGDWTYLITALKSLGDNLRLLVTSRNYSTIRKLFEDDEELHVRADDGDVRQFIMSQLDITGRFPLHLKDRDDLREKILTGVLKKAQGMFLLASTLLSQSGNRADLIMELNKLPDTMTNAYGRLLDRVDKKVEHDKKLAYHIFGWIAFAKRPLTALELQYALAVRPGTKELDPDSITDYDVITSVCVGLVVVDSKGSPASVHYTTQEYFTSHNDVLFPRIQENITRTCLTYMSFNIFDSPGVVTSKSYEEQMNYYHFLRYSSNNWTYHARQCTPGSIEKEILTFLSTRTEIALSFEQPPDSKPSLPRTPAWFASHYGLIHVMKILVDGGVDLQEENTLCIAAHAGQLGIVNMLLSRNDVEVNQADKAMCLDLYPKTGSNDSESYIRATAIEKLRFWATSCTPLIAAASNGHEEIVKTLLESKSMESLNMLPPSGPTALSAAVLGNHIGIVKLLLSQLDIDTSIQFKGRTPLMLAARYGRRDIVRMLLEREDDDLDVPSDNGSNALHIAAKWRRYDIFEMLLKSGRVAVNSTDGKGRTALVIAARLGFVQSVKMLLDHTDIDIAVKDYKGRSAYQIAVEQGRDEIVELLEEHGGRVPGTDMDD